MPELPEVETIRRDLQYAILGKGIRKVEVLTGRCLKNDHEAFTQRLEGNRFESIGRKGKLLFFELAYGDKTMLVHLKMTGQLICQIPGGLIVGGHPMAKIDDLPNQYTHLAIHFADKSVLYFNDIRTFGYVQLTNEVETATVLRKFGIEPLTADFTWEAFSDVLKNRTTCIKSVLLNQQLIAGIGNIYADEICYRAKIRPDRKINTLSTAEKKRIFSACTKILDQAVAKRGTTFSNFVDASGKKGGYIDHLKVYQREGERCFRCGDDYIQKTRLAGRGTHFCDSCQK